MVIAVLPDTRDALNLLELRRLARTFDAISDETGARYSAEAFVEFVRCELADEDEQEPVATA